MRSASFLALTAAAVTSLTLLAAPNLAAQAAPTQDAPALTTEGTESTPTRVRVATFNVRTARADIGTTRQWLHRALSVAQEIDRANPGIVSIQELGPGRADGQRISVGDGLRQTTSLLKELDSIGADRYQLTRTTAYVEPGAYHGTQGPRILFDKTKYRLVSNCVETTGKSNWNPSCAMVMPTVKAVAPISAAYAEFEDRSTGRNFFVISAHLDSRHSSTLSTEKSYDALRAAQASAIYAKVNSLADGKPIIFGGDINSWRTKAGSHAPYNYLYGKGFREAAAKAPSKINAQYPTVNHWYTTLKANAAGRQVALDVVMLNRGKSFSTYENVMKVVDSSRPSDHNMVVADLTL